ncbi:right-handed parallel beta-helix repeat-containing protein [Neobacillus niacini]|uniref:right-handed parallel beta-helix repeat-containing protein n=1 Tax=Neobacillus niacini TaxID=86668 RepID=UPI002FFFFC1C
METIIILKDRKMNQFRIGVGVLGSIKRKRRKSLKLFLIMVFLITAMVIFWGNTQKKELKRQERLNIETQMLKGEALKESLKSLTLDTTSFTLKNKESRQAYVTANYLDGSSQNVTELSFFSTSNKNVATVDSSGLITAKGSGFASITISYQGMTNAITVSVSSHIFKADVKEFGAYGDGVRDDTTAFQNAINAVAEKGGGDVYVPEGTYILEPIFLKSKVNLVGESRDNVVLKLSDQAPDDYTRVINLENIGNVKIRNITCDGNSQNHLNGIEHMHCIFVWDSKNILIDNNRLINAVGDGISISGSTETSDYVIISNNILEDNRRSNIVLEQVNNLQIFNNISTSNIGRPALHFEPWEEMSFYGAEIWNNTFASNNTEGYCVQLEGGKEEGNFFHDVNFYENIVNCPTGQFLIMETKKAKIHHNTLNVSAVFVWIKNEDLKISNNKINSQNGIVIEGTWGILSKRTVIADNSITTLGFGVLINAGSKDTTIRNNKFIGKGGIAVKFFATATDITNTIILDNSFDNFEFGVFTDYNYYDDKRINDLLIQGNTFKNFDEYALYIKGTTQNVTFDNNIIKNASGVDIAANDRLMSNIMITSNTISSGKRGITQHQAGSGSLKGLTISDNRISLTTYKGDDYSTGAAIELDRTTVPPTDVSIIGNTLTNNAKNFITVPNSLSKSVNNNQY